MNTYTLTINGLTRELPIIPINEQLSIASFVILGDTELVCHVAPLLADKLPEVDYIVTAEAKGIPLIHELTKVLGMKHYILARKSVKAYMENPLIHQVNSITTDSEQLLCLDGKDSALLKGKKVAIIDDVISTGESILALEELVMQAGATVEAKAAILAEGDASERDDIIFLERLPVF
ncbi:phosphoribosyltransferase family protein [Gracilibacillus sp. S3-1-1]|uniref:Phosphoribosyltransferase family protein n=1 Tax=Gracilibacillus pellucidus TaxID=3095368 RepID=A0ACC6M3L5_9BACI|nr:phosphoribosyltransferase family protein [Gracilibacillus sp. S3-1-1]MDX8045553.1 phosphoribosyltransferase family protein [Gracilibacillus sp. S3-1-1]